MGPPWDLWGERQVTVRVVGRGVCFWNPRAFTRGRSLAMLSELLLAPTKSMWAACGGPTPQIR